MDTRAPEALNRGAVLLQAPLRRADVPARTADDDPDFSTREASESLALFLILVLANWTDFDDLCTTPDETGASLAIFVHCQNP